MQIIKSLLLTTLLLPVLAMADVSLINTAYKVVLVEQANGAVTEEWQDLGRVVPGDTIGYRISYKNSGTETASDVAINNPIPKNTDYLANSAKGLNSQITYSADMGQTFARAAELFVIKDGKQQLARPTDITNIRWSLAAIAAGAEGSVEFKVRVQ
ncbi:DUF11 domain-containing protein [Oceanobacter mangrovi]|uniref:DUF11 domain-containing protein n=1 Tax=Oceanobacter mangrovi TaxID=2862510 RepID=UPI001C8DB48E|nr:DUF11 domain-containing protein [Oceanobacter mangrovi]